jgi:hypothetical protein
MRSLPLRRVDAAVSERAAAAPLLVQSEHELSGFAGSRSCRRSSGPAIGGEEQVGLPERERLPSRQKRLRSPTRLTPLLMEAANAVESE